MKNIIILILAGQVLAFPAVTRTQNGRAQAPRPYAGRFQSMRPQASASQPDTSGGYKPPAKATASVKRGGEVMTKKADGRNAAVTVHESNGLHDWKETSGSYASGHASGETASASAEGRGRVSARLKNGTKGKIDVKSGDQSMSVTGGPPYKVKGPGLGFSMQHGCVDCDLPGQNPIRVEAGRGLKVKGTGNGSPLAMNVKAEGKGEVSATASNRSHGEDERMDEVNLIKKP